MRGTYSAPEPAAEVYQALGPITDKDRAHLAGLSARRRSRWFQNIYGRATARYARFQYKAGAR